MSTHDTSLTELLNASDSGEDAGGADAEQNISSDDEQELIAEMYSL